MRKGYIKWFTIPYFVPQIYKTEREKIDYVKRYFQLTHKGWKPLLVGTRVKAKWEGDKDENI